ncbi:superinfection immunity protein [Pseudomonas sp. LP_4_YM]|uniref:superinfection immunity protein n=1 Tax=Pseudomonas sp. LP_4_YM TaxID=2485135 RepID=UPI00104E69F3|nr:superinfection immunity protein [Pseudomonas sp. LP_4_YM]TCT87612.1 putative oligomerization/nucleic acid binding protein [Pseudomonas sp. LP_4_YM]
MSEGSGTLAIVLFFIAVIIYFLPSFNASSRKHPNTSSIVLLNLFLGWTLIGWVASLVWSASSIAKPSPIVTPVSHAAPADSGDKYQQIEKLGSLKERGLISEDEYQNEKIKLLNS